MAFGKQQPTFNPEEKTKGGFLIDMIQTVIIALTISVVIYLFIAIPNQIDGQSMEPNFHDQELLLTNKIIQWFGQSPAAVSLGLAYDYDRGDVVIFTFNDTDLIKRIVAVAGDSVRIEDNRVFVNDKQLDEKYIPTTTRTRSPFDTKAFIKEGETVTVPDDHFFMLGDNRENSKDSRFSEIGFVHRDMVKGRVFFRYWPLDKFGIIRRGEFAEIDPS
ncbi:MAG: signal peptidase I [Candidatus Dojkabacteria bacterium]